VLAAAGALLLCGQALSQEKIRLPRKGSAPGFEMPLDGNRHVPRHAPRQGNEAGPAWEPSWDERERWTQREREERRVRVERAEREARTDRLEGQDRQDQQDRQERQAADCREQARKAQAAQEQAKRKVVIGYLAGGLLGALITSSQNDEAYKEPKVVWDETYNNCMGLDQQGRRKDEQSDDDDGEDD
jgi:hypothetical protein